MQLHLPRSIDDPPYLLIWRLDHVVWLVLAILIGILVDRMWICLGIGLLLVHFIQRYEDGWPDGYVFHLLYWWGLWPTRGRTVRNAYQREWLP